MRENDEDLEAEPDYAAFGEAPNEDGVSVFCSLSTFSLLV